MKLFLSLTFLSLSCSLWAQPQKSNHPIRVESQPTYTKWQKNYFISKISFFERRTILDLKFVFERGTKEWTKSVIFMPPNTVNSWCLKDPESGQIFDLLEISAVKRNGVEIKERIKSPKDKVQIELPLEGRPKEVFTCQVHFPRLPNELKIVDLLEGPNSKYSKGHWNFFDIQLFPVAPEKTAPSMQEKKETSDVRNDFKLTSDNPPQDQPVLPSALVSMNDIKCNKKLELSEIVFQDNSIKFQNIIKAERTLSILRTYLLAYPNSQIELYGHTDIFGTPQRNLDLSQQRVDKLKDWFIQRSISTSRIKTHALGGTQPLFPKGNAKNRRVEVQILCDLSPKN